MANVEAGTGLTVELVHSPQAGAVVSIRLCLPAGSVVADALRQAGITGAARVGIWGRPCAPTQPLRDGDRVEVYRPLQVDPKEARRTRQRQQISGSRR